MRERETERLLLKKIVSQEGEREERGRVKMVERGKERHGSERRI